MSKKSRLARKFLFIHLLYFLAITNLAAQSLLVNQADSLSACGYHDEEIVLRKKIWKANPNSTAKIFWDLAEMNRLSQFYEDDKARALSENILKAFEKLPPKEKKVVEVAIDRMKANNLSANEKYDEAIALLTNTLKKVKANGSKAGELYLNIGQTLTAQGKYYEATKFFKKAIAIFEKNGWKNHYVNALAYNDLAFAYDYANTEKDMLPTFEKALEIWTKYYSTDAGIVSVAYNDAIFAAMEYGDRKKSAEFQKNYDTYMAHYMANKSKYKQNKPYNDAHARGMYHLSSLRFYDENFDESKILYHIKEQERLFANCPKASAEKEKGILLSSYDAASYAFYMNYQSEKALYYNQIIDRLSGDNNFYKMKTSANRAMLYYYKNDFAQSLIHNEKALGFLQILGFKSSYLTLLTLKAENLANLGKIVESKAALKEVYKTEFDKDIPLDKINIKDFGEVNNSSYINIFIHSGMAYRRIFEKNGKNKADLKIIRNMYHLAGDMFKDYYKKGFFNPELERQLNNIKEGMMFTALHSPADKAYLAQCINTLEDISSQHLWKQFLSKYSNNLNLSKDLINKRNELVMELSYLHDKQEKKPAELKHEQDLENQLNVIDDEIANKYPSYERFQGLNFDVNSLQKTLQPKQFILKYYVSDSSVFACKISPKDLELKYLGKKPALEKLTKTYHTQMSSIDFGFEKNARSLYQLLLAPIKAEANSHIIIIPENFLNYCPFEALLNEKNEPMANEQVLSYANSLKFSQKIFDKVSPSFEHFLTGFAPKYQNGIGVTRAANGQLIYTGTELRNISKIFGQSVLYTDEEATKANFLKSLGSSHVHHLAMHSIVDEKDYEYSSLVFQNNEKLHFYELYALNFPSELVVLSACNTGIGEYLNGEGLMSISRALNYAGVKSTIHSLWQVPDKETSELMSYFYEFLNEGMGKDLALVKAKREFIHKNPMKNHPYYWSGFIINGDVSALSTSNDSLWLWLTLGLLIVAVLVFYFYRKTQSSTKISRAL